MIVLLAVSQLISWALIGCLCLIYCRAGGILTVKQFIAALKPLKSFVSFDKNNYPTVAHIQKIVCIHTGITHAELVSKDRHRNIIEARQKAEYFCYLLADRKANSLETIAYHFNANYSTVIHSYNTVCDMIDVYPSFKAEIEKIKNKIFERMN